MHEGNCRECNTDLSAHERPRRWAVGAQSSDSALTRSSDNRPLALHHQALKPQPLLLQCWRLCSLGAVPNTEAACRSGHATRAKTSYPLRFAEEKSSRKTSDAEPLAYLQPIHLAHRRPYRTSGHPQKGSRERADAPVRYRLQIG